MSLKRHLTPLNERGSSGENIRHEGEPRPRRKLAMSDAGSPDPLSDEELNWDIFSQNLIAESEVDIQNIDLDHQPEQLRPDDVELWPWEVTSTSEELYNATQEHSMTYLETGTIEEQVCFGMLVREKVKLIGEAEKLYHKILTLQESNISRQVFQIRPSSNEEFFLIFPDATELGYLSERMKKAFEPLKELPHFELEAHITLKSIMDALSKAKTAAEAAIRVEVHVYGSNILRDQFGRQISNGHLFLQHPDMCRPGIRYDNPHILRFDDLEDSELEGETDATEDDVEADLSVESDEEIKETITTVYQFLRRPNQLKRLKESGTMLGSLYPHQEEALDFMTQRETGDIPPEYRLWQLKTNNAEQAFFNVITHEMQQEKPDESGGGILADAMGMGKSLTTLALIFKTTRDARQWAAHSNTSSKDSLASKPCRATLVIVPRRCTITSNHFSA
ncbi:SNF2 family N-terminal domain-containing protein [Penicillium frequentans]|nr:SNF2 family N-terminal domain-containing protein [Penicillium glabrum]